MISVALLGESDIALELEALLHQFPDMTFLGHLQFNALRLKVQKPNLIIMALICQHEACIEEIKLLRAESKVLAISPHCKADFVLKVMRAGVHAYLWQEEFFEDLPETLRCIAGGKRIFSEGIAINLR